MKNLIAIILVGISLAGCGGKNLDGQEKSPCACNERLEVINHAQA